MRVSKVRGHTLTELVIVIAILAIVAAVAMPNLSPDNDAALDLAAIEVAGAVRFAHSEAIRTGEPHGINADYFAQRIRVYHLDTSVNPFAVHYDMRDPLTKQLYDLRFGAPDVAISLVYFKFEGSFFPQSFLGFAGGTGLPKYNDSGTVRMLETGYIRLSHDGVQRAIQISPMTGRVTVQ